MASIARCRDAPKRGERDGVRYFSQKESAFIQRKPLSRGQLPVSNSRLSLPDAQSKIWLIRLSRTSLI